MRNPVSRGKFTYNVGRAGDSVPLLPTAAEAVKPAPPSAGNRKQRRRQATATKLLTRRLKKDDIPLRIETLPDGGLHITVDTREET